MARKIRWFVKCGKTIKSKHRKKSAAQKARPPRCRVVKA